VRGNLRTGVDIGGQDDGCHDLSLVPVTIPRIRDGDEANSREEGEGLHVD
jgi:hypothetical protein